MQSSPSPQTFPNPHPSLSHSQSQQKLLNSPLQLQTFHPHKNISTKEQTKNTSSEGRGHLEGLYRQQQVQNISEFDNFGKEGLVGKEGFKLAIVHFNGRAEYEVCIGGLQSDVARKIIQALDLELAQK